MKQELPNAAALSYLIYESVKNFLICEGLQIRYEMTLQILVC
jgi:hypothetical protein